MLKIKKGKLYKHLIQNLECICVYNNRYSAEFKVTKIKSDNRNFEVGAIWTWRKNRVDVERCLKEINRKPHLPKWF